MIPSQGAVALAFVKIVAWDVSVCPKATKSCCDSCGARKNSAPSHLISRTRTQKTQCSDGRTTTTASRDRRLKSGHLECHGIRPHAHKSFGDSANNGRAERDRPSQLLHSPVSLQPCKSMTGIAKPNARQLTIYWRARNSLRETANHCLCDECLGRRLHVYPSKLSSALSRISRESGFSRYPARCDYCGKVRSITRVDTA